MDQIEDTADEQAARILSGLPDGHPALVALAAGRPLIEIAHELQNAPDLMHAMLELNIAHARRWLPDPYEGDGPWNAAPAFGHAPRHDPVARSPLY